MLDDFSYRSYGQLLDLARANNRNLRFCDLPAGADADRYFILRHDVDFSPLAAMRMAEFEAHQGVRSTYFLLLSSEFYNLLSAEYCAIPRRLVDLGHEVGLHYDLGCYDIISPSRPLEVLLNQAEALSQLCGAPVRSIAMHNPSVYGADVFQDVHQFTNAYDPRYAREIAYYSDSGGAWRDETAARLHQGDIPARFQLLIHPIFWDEQPGDRWTRLSSLLDTQRQFLERSAAAIRGFWTRHAGVLEHDARAKSGLASH